eukprot:SAG31_NODE_767_length_12232_cov_6.917827_11_plen_45_part_00
MIKAVRVALDAAGFKEEVTPKSFHQPSSCVHQSARERRHIDPYP